MTTSMRTHNHQVQYATELARLKKEREKENKEKLEELKYKYIILPRKR
jgi:hypothetical protein